MSLDLQPVLQPVFEAIDPSFVWAGSSPVRGGCIHNAQRIRSADGRSWFVKLADARLEDLLQAEREGLEALAQTGTVRVPQVVDSGTSKQHAWLVLEWLDLSSLTDASATELGRQLAALHRKTRATFGGPASNFLGASPQPNAERSDWVDFFLSQRIEPQLRRASERSQPIEASEAQLERIAERISHQPSASLVHGDLWGGNIAQAKNGQPVVFDPAVFYGDRETDLAFTRLFGGFPPRFYEAYEEAWPLPEGARNRIEVYNLYHLINHAVLFGGSYAAQAQAVINAL